MLSLSDIEHRLYDAMLEDTVQDNGSATAPAGGTDIASVSLSAGTWEITAVARLGSGGVPAAGDVDNMRLANATAAEVLLVLPVIATQNSVPVPISVRKTLDVTSTIVIEAVGAGTASVVYLAHLICRKVADS